MGSGTQNAKILAVPAESQSVQQLAHPHLRSRWDAIVWPRWLPVHARLPLIAQITGAVALTALLAAPWWSSIPDTAADANTAVAAPRPAGVPASPVTAPPVTTPVAAVETPIAVPAAGSVESASAVPTPVTPVDLRPAHLNLDVRHSFRIVDFSVTVDGKPALQTKLEGSGKRFKVFGKRSERGYTKTIDLPVGVSVVRVRVLSTEEKFDQTRVERFELGSASVATLRVSADKSGLSLVAERPPSPKPSSIQPGVQSAPPLPTVVPTAASTIPIPGSAAPRTSQEANAVVDLLQSVRSILIAIAGFVASAATGFVVQEYLRSRKGLLFTGGPGEGEESQPNERRRRRRPGRARLPREDRDPGDIDSGVPAGDSGVRPTNPSSLTSE